MQEVEQCKEQLPGAQRYSIFPGDHCVTARGMCFSSRLGDKRNIKAVAALRAVSLLIQNYRAEDEAGGEVLEVPVRAMHAVQVPVRNVAVSRKVEADAVVIVVVVVVDAVAVAVMMVPVAVMEIVPVPAIRGMPAAVMVVGSVSAVVGEMPASVRAVAPALMTPMQVALAVAIGTCVVIVAAPVVMVFPPLVTIPPMLNVAVATLLVPGAVMQPFDHAACLMLRTGIFPPGFRGPRPRQQKQGAEYSGHSVYTHTLLRQRVALYRTSLEKPG